VTFEEHLLGLVEGRVVKGLATRRETHDEHPSLDENSVEEEGELPEVDLGSAPSKCVWEIATFSIGVIVVLAFTCAT